MRRLLAGIAVLGLLLTGCTAQSKPVAAPSGSGGTLLAAHGLTGKTAVETIDYLDRLGLGERPATLKASVRPHELILTAGTEEQRLTVPADRFYLSVAPYADRTHDCFHHSLTTCKGELGGKDVQVRVVQKDSGKVLVDETRTTFGNGFTGLWLPRGIEGTLRVTYGGKSGETAFATSDEAPTCLTTLRLT